MIDVQFCDRRLNDSIQMLSLDFVIHEIHPGHVLGTGEES